MSKKKHTPFENALAEAYLLGGLWILQHRHAPTESEIFNDPGIKEVIANQTKEGAAPELYEACKLTKQYFNQEGGPIQTSTVKIAIYKAIAKAGGQP